MAGPQFVKYFRPVILALKDLGNSARPAQVRDWIATHLELEDEELNALTNSGSPRFENRVAWARFYLSRAGYLDSSKRGVWNLTEKGINADFDDAEAIRIFRETHRQFTEDSGEEDSDEQTADVEQTLPPDADVLIATDYRTELLSIIRQLPPAGFEKLCRRLLLEAGFQKVDVTGRTGDGGIDGKGILQVNPLVSFQVIFQCKRYNAQTAISVSQVRDFRGSMAGRTDKGIYLTTSTFTADARREAEREGVPPIELIDAEKFVDMFVSLDLGVKPKTIYEVDKSFFEEFTH